MTISTKNRPRSGRWLADVTDYTNDGSGRMARVVPRGDDWLVYEVDPGTDTGLGTPDVCYTAQAAADVARAIVSGEWR